MKRFAQKGYSVVELAIAVLIMGVMVGTIMGARTFMAKQTQNNSDKAYATEKAIQMFEELKSLVNNQTQNFTILDSYSQSTTYDSVLTTDTNVDKPTTGVANPLDPESGNRAYGNGYRYARKVFIAHTNDVYTRVIYVWVYGAMGNSAATTATLPLLAQVTGVVRINISPQLPAQVMDVYLLAIQNVQGWWSQVPSLEGTFGNIVTDLNVVNNNTLAIRPHYITRLSYGRDPYYQPYINSANDTDGAPSSWVYLYPGSVQDDSGNDENFYEPDTNGVLQTGNFMIDGVSSYPSYPNNASGNQSVTYSVADQYNDAVRYPDELAAYAAVTAQAATLVSTKTSSLGITEISERMLIEQMNSSPQSFTNAIIVNLHGEMMPMPPMHNYSDAAKDPGNVIYGNSAVSLNSMAVSTAAKDARVVTHPELLYYPTTVASGNITMRLRVYAYYDGLDSCAVTGAGAVTAKPGDPELPGISVLLKNLYIPASSAGASLAITAVSGGSGVTYQDIAVTNVGGTGNFLSSRAADPVSVVVTNPIAGTNTLITLYNTRLRAAQGSNNTGLNQANELFGLEYIPCSADVTGPVTNFNSYTFTNQDLSSATANVPKNTARWIIQLNSVPVTIGAAGGGPLTIETRIGAGVTTSVAGASLSALPLSAGATIPGISTAVTLMDVPTNLSRTYAWLGVTPPPYTERYQYTGDPRDCPYLDVKVGGPQVSGLVTIGPYSYNWWFRDITNGATGVDGYLGFMNTSEGWGTTASNGPILMNQDVPRYFQTLRNGLLNTTSIWSNVNGWSDYYMGFGGEIGYDQAPFSGSVTYNATPWSTAVTTWLRPINEIVTESWEGAAFKTYERIPANVGKSGGPSTDAWYAKPWLGEIYPDSQFASFWYKYGNLPTAAMAAATFTAATNPVTFYREDMNNINNNVVNGSTTYTTTEGFTLGELGKSPGPWGCQSFAGGTPNGSVSGNTLEHDGGPNNTQTGTILSLATTCFSIFGVPLSGSVSCTRPWDINYAATSGTPKPPEWGIAVTANGYSNGYSIPVTTSIAAVSAVSRIFYNSDDTNTGTWHGSGVVQLTNAVSQRAYLIESGLATSAQFGPEQLGKTSMVFMLRTFLDGGLMSGVSQIAHITQLPLIQETTPEEKDEQYQNPQTIHVVVSSAVANTNNPWFRFEGLSSTAANFYTQEYPGYTTSAPLTASTYSEAATQAFLLNFKYSVENSSGGSSSVTWYYMSSAAPIASQAQTGILNNAYAVTVSSFPTTFSWNVSDPAAFPAANYNVLCEAYRKGYPLHYSYHSITLTIDR